MVTVRRTVQSLLALALCLVIAADLGGFYAVPAVATTLIAMSTGAYVLLAIGAGLVWPVLVVAYVVFVTRESRLRAATHDRPRRPTSETGLLGVEDP